MTGLWLARRKELDFPLGSVPELATQSSVKTGAVPISDLARDFLLEIGSEELPPQDVESAMTQLRCETRSWLDAFLIHDRG